jgi:hypothetical protein
VISRHGARNRIAGVSLVDSYRTNAGYLEAVGSDLAIVPGNVKQVTVSIKKCKAGGAIGVSRQFETILTSLAHWGLHARAIRAIYTMGEA